MFNLCGRGRRAVRLAVILPLGFAAAGAADAPRPYSAGHQALVTALEGQRVIVARLTGGFSYAPPSPGTPAIGTGQAFIASVVRAAATIEREAEQMPGPTSWAALAVLRLHQQRVDEAVPLLARASETSPDDGRFWADLAAAMFERGARERRVSDLARAVRYAETALARGGAAQARFTRALALERLGLRREATAAWSILAAAEEEGWRDEAARHAAELQRGDAAESWQRTRRVLRAEIERGETANIAAAARAFPEQLRSEAEDQWLGDWGDAITTGDERSARDLLLALQTAAAALSDRTGDTLLADSLRTLDEAWRLAAAGDRSQLEALASAHRLYRDARVLQEEERYSGSRALLAEALPRFAAAASPFVLWVRYRDAVAVYHAPDHEDALARLKSLRVAAAGPQRHVLAGHVEWMVGLTHLRQGEWTAALAAFADAERSFTACGEVENVAAIRNLRIWALQPLGREEAAEHELAAVLADLPRLVKPRRIFNALNSASDMLRRSGEDSTALYFQDEVLAIANSAGNPNWIARAYWQRAELLERSGAGERADADLDQALRHAERIAEVGEKFNVEVAVLQVRSRVAAANNDARRAIQLLDRATSLVEAHGIRFPLLALLSDRAAVRLVAGDFAAAQRDLALGLAELDRQAGEAESDADRLALREASRRLFELLVRLEVDRGNELTAARDAAECLRRRGLSAPSKPGVAMVSAPATSAVSTAVPGGAILEFLALPDRLYFWFVLPDRVVFHQQPLAASALIGEVADFVRTLRSGDAPAAEAYAGRLRALLLEPAMPHLAGITSLWIVPDRALRSLPFAALTLGDHSYLAERYAITIALSSRRLDDATNAPDETAGAGADRVLLVGAEDAEAEDGKALPGVAREIAELAKIYPGATVLRGLMATPQRLLQELPRHSIFHFAGHAREAPPELVLAGGSASAADLRTCIPSDRPPRLAILAGCRSGAGPTSGELGAQNLARVLLERGVPNVVASLWDVEDGTAWQFSRAFHDALRRGRDPASALREAQRHFLDSADPLLRQPAAWSTYQLLASGIAGERRGG